MANLNKSWYKKWWIKILITILIIFLIIAIIFSFFLFDAIKKINNQTPIRLAETDEQNNTELKKLIYGNNDNYWIGSADPKITIVEFADFSCAYCASSFQKIRELSVKYKDKIKIIFRDYPITTDYSADLAMAARCAGEQGLFWVMHDKLFLNSGISKKTDIIKLALQSGADINRFEVCLNDKKHLSKIQKDMADSQALEISGTPAWFINEAKVEGDIPYDIFVQIIEKLLK
ncbi:MAG: thioredoxin domain-containing protein [Patescibacteria group bacterium]|nr:thioredoxin domain-containing protein [Patescibacteria group bacterium]